mgnify:CR=1 FL=1
MYVLCVYSYNIHYTCIRRGRKNATKKITPGALKVKQVNSKNVLFILFINQLYLQGKYYISVLKITWYCISVLKITWIFFITIRRYLASVIYSVNCHHFTFEVHNHMCVICIHIRLGDQVTCHRPRLSSRTLNENPRTTTEFTWEGFIR